MNSNIENQLAPPGAGLPAIERFIGGRIFALKRFLGSRDHFTEEFVRERNMIHELVKSCPASARSERVLIPRLRGLEDSSRYWSVWMTLDHLRITNLAFAQVISSLAVGQVPSRKANTADVKPSPTVSADVESAYETSCDQVLQSVSLVKDLKTAAKYAHPWFGPLDAAGWQAMTSMHLGIHRAQLEGILRRFNR